MIGLLSKGSEEYEEEEKKEVEKNEVLFWARPVCPNEVITIQVLVFGERLEL